MSAVYHPPILVSVLRALGWLSLLVSVLLLLIAFEPFSVSAGLSHFSDVKNNHDIAMLSMPLVPTGIVLAAALFFFGAGQFIESIAQIAYNLHKLCEQNESLAFKSAATPPGAIPIPPLTTFQKLGPGENHPGFTPESRLFQYRLGDTIAGPVDERELQRLVNLQVIDHDTDIRAEGVKDWCRLEDMAEP